MTAIVHDYAAIAAQARRLKNRDIDDAYQARRAQEIRDHNHSLLSTFISCGGETTGQRNLRRIGQDMADMPPHPLPPVQKG